MRDIKRSTAGRRGAGADRPPGLRPPTLLAQASRLPFSDRLYNIVVTNVPGPQVPLFLLGRELTALFPVPPLIGDRALAIAVISYNGGVSFGLLGDFDALPDIDLIADGIAAALARARGTRPRLRGLRRLPQTAARAPSQLSSYAPASGATSCSHRRS